MSDSDEMRRLILHAAELLDACDPAANAAEVRRHSHSLANVQAAYERAVAEAAAIATARTVLCMVAACMAVEGDDG